MPTYFADTSGRPSDPQALLRRIGAKAPAELAVGGVMAARHWDRDFDLHGIPRWQFLARPGISHLRVHYGEMTSQLESLRA